MKNLVKTKVVIAIMMIASVVFVLSCNKDDESVIPVKEEKLDNDNLVLARAGYNPAYDFYEGPLNSNVVKDPGYVYYWRITDNSGTLFNPKVKFFGPDGSETYITMTKTGNMWILNKDLMKNGRYYWRYVDNSGNNLTSWNSYVDNIRIRTGNDYPYPLGQCTVNTNACIDDWNFYKYNCTSWVAWKVNQMWGTSTAFWNKMISSSNTLGNAINWKNKLTSIGYIANNEPIVGSIAYWGGYPANATQGHVAFVTQVHKNSSGAVTSIGVEHFNRFADHKYYAETISVGGLWWPHSFIHVQHRR